MDAMALMPGAGLCLRALEVTAAPPRQVTRVCRGLGSGRNGPERALTSCRTQVLPGAARSGALRVQVEVGGSSLYRQGYREKQRTGGRTAAEAGRDNGLVPDGGERSMQVYRRVEE